MFSSNKSLYQPMLHVLATKNPTKIDLQSSVQNDGCAKNRGFIAGAGSKTPKKKAPQLLGSCKSESCIDWWLVVWEGGEFTFKGWKSLEVLPLKANIGPENHLFGSGKSSEPNLGFRVPAASFQGCRHEDPKALKEGSIWPSAWNQVGKWKGATDWRVTKEVNLKSKVKRATRGLSLLVENNLNTCQIQGRESRNCSR